MTAKHTYPSSFGPDSSMWSVRVSWSLLDQIKPGIIPEEARFLLAGMIAGAVHEAYEIGHEDADPEKHPHAVRRPQSESTT